MKVLVILEVDEDQVIEAHHGEDPSTYEGTLEGAIEGELGWSSESGISVIEVLCPDNPEMGNIIRKHLDGENDTVN